MKLFILAMLLSLQASATMRVLMIDAGSPPLATGRNYSLNGFNLYHFHAEAMWYFITHNTKCMDYVVDYCTYFKDDDVNVPMYERCLKVALEGNYAIVNMSLSGVGIMTMEKNYIAQIVQHSVVVAAAGNSGKQECRYPASYPGVISISNRLPTSTHAKKSLDFIGDGVYYNSVQGTLQYMQGTSIGAALYTKKLIEEMCPSRRRIHGQE